MKDKLMKTLKLGILILGISLFFTNCQKDEIISEKESNAIIQTNSQSDFTIQTLELKDIESNTYAFNKIKSIKNKSNKTNKNSKNPKVVYSSDQDFSIDTGIVKYIQNQDSTYHSYTFPIYRANNNFGLENLMLSSQNDGAYKTFIVTYDLTEQEVLDLNNNLPVDLNNKVSFAEFKDDQLVNNIFAKQNNQATTIVIITEEPCSHPEHQDDHLTASCTHPTTSTSSLHISNTSNVNQGVPDPAGETNPTTNNYGGGVTSPTASSSQIKALLLNNIKDCITNLTTQQNSYLNSLNNIKLRPFSDFLNTNNCDDKAKEFLKSAIESLINGGEVDFEEELILDSDLKDNDCLYSVYTGMGKSTTFANYLNNFDGDMSVANLKLTSSTTLDANTNAETSAPQNYLITITFNENNLDRPILSIARTFIHEMIHAETFRKLLSVAQHPSIQLDHNQLIQLRNDYPGLYDYYMRWKWNVPQGQSPSSAQHEAMAQHYRGIIKQALKEFDNSQTNEIYEALAWTGLQNTVAWNNLTQTKRDSISQTIADFNINNPNCQ
ncbi:hypothetical protein V6246_09790 [Algibacter sp. TI.3.09]|uniref:hypothetical protein n=1 Tax=Algibacter sp. TI.3.09 TaxID=3121298 RepID=UPI00311E7C18